MTNRQLKEFDKELERQKKQDSERTQIYCSVQGLGTVSARILANELGDMTQFPNFNRQGSPVISEALTGEEWGQDL